MIEYVNGDMFTSGADCIVNPVNCVGVMGGGLALEFKQRFPEMFEIYRMCCAKGILHVGTVVFWRAPDTGVYVCNFPTKDHWRYPSTVEIVQASLDGFCDWEVLDDLGIKSVAFPAVGCGLGGLDFARDVKPLMEKAFGDSSLDVKVYLQ